ncbi:29841_t:CDS:2, partial [Gigaspora margarita]
VSSTCLIERSRKQNLEMEKLGIYRNIFASSEAEIQQQLQYKIKEKIEICKKEEVLVNGLDFERKEKEEIEKNKEILIITECDVPDYEIIIANIKQMEVHSKMEMDINIDNKTEIVDKTSNEFDKVEDINSSI